MNVSVSDLSSASVGKVPLPLSARCHSVAFVMIRILCGYRVVVESDVSIVDECN